MKKLKKTFSTILLLFLMFAFTSCGNNNKQKSNEDMIEERIDAFVSAYNDGDMDGVIACLDRQTGNTVRATFNILSALGGATLGVDLSISDLFALGVAIEGEEPITVNITSIKIADKKAVVTTISNISDPLYFTMKFENDGWYIHDITDENNSTSTSEKEEINTDEILTIVDTSFLKEQSASEGLQYTLNEDKTFYILTGLGECEDTHIVLPEYPVDYNPIPLKEIRASFYDVEYITIPASVTKIHSVGSYSYSDLIAINYLGNLEQWCTMEYSNSSANPCADNAVLYINGTPIVETLKIPETTEHINAYAFYNYDKISKIEIGKSVESIGEKSFYGCDYLQSISFGNDKPLSIGTQTFGFCKKLKNIDFANKTRSIGTSSFADCSSIEEITLGNAIEEIGNNAFTNCINLKSITKGNTATNISGNAFTNTAFYNNGSNWENGLLYVGNCLYAIKPDVINVNINEETLTISNNLFKNHDNITNVVLSDSIESITESMFENCKSLKSIILSSTLKSIENNAFRYCSSLVEIVIPDSVESIGLYAFYNCSELKSITFGKGIKTIKDCFNYTALETIKYNGTFDQWIQIDNDCFTAYDGAEMCGCLVYSTQTGMPIDAFYYDGHYYRVFERSNGNWEDAKLDCEALGGHLVTLTSKEENEAIIGYIRSINRCNTAYIGLSDANEEGVWEWVTGEPVEYLNFYDNEPNGFDSENYAMIYRMHSEGYWSDESGKGIDSYWNGFSYICEWEPHNS